ncbi:mCG147323 [Mus musculus]|uniref:Uncharacterized protein n=1 Tax=Mus musculus TaxID=10090 RepID=Q8CBV7_MOUSE|nr:mCG147323 [Mus musculus]BAC28734.1 unnamed protein product [Mus musculus]
MPAPAPALGKRQEGGHLALAWAGDPSLGSPGHAEHPPAPNQAGFGRLHSPQLGCPCGPARCRPHRARGVPPVQRGALGSGRRGCPDLTSLGWPAYALSEQNRTHSLGTGRKPWPHCRLLGDLGQIRSPL